MICVHGHAELVICTATDRMKAAAAAALLGVVLCCLMSGTLSVNSLSQKKPQEERKKEASLSPTADLAKEGNDVIMEEIGEAKEKCNDTLSSALQNKCNVTKHHYCKNNFPIIY